MAAMTPVTDLTVEQQQIARRRKMIDAMLAQSMESSQGVVSAGGRNVQANIADPITKLANAYFGSKMDKQNASEEMANAKAQNVNRAQGTLDYIAQREGMPRSVGQDTRALDVSGAEGAAPDAQMQMKPDQLGAIRSAMLSNDPFLMQIAQQDLAGMRKQELGAKDLLHTPGASVASRVKAAQSGNLGELRDEPKYTVVDGRLVETSGPEPTLKGDYREKFGPVGQIPGAPNTYGQTGDTGKVHFAPKGVNVSQNVDMKGEGAFATTAGAGWAKTLQEGRDNIQNAVRGLPTLIAAHELAAKAQTGFGANEILTARRLAQQFGVGEDQTAKITDSQTYMVAMAPQIINVLKALRPADKTDREFAQQVTAQDLSQDPQTMQRAIRLAAAETVRHGKSHQENVAAAERTYPMNANVARSYNVDIPEIPQGWLTTQPNGQVGANLNVPGTAPAGPYQIDEETRRLMQKHGVQ